MYECWQSGRSYLVHSSQPFTTASSSLRILHFFSDLAPWSSRAAQAGLGLKAFMAIINSTEGQIIVITFTTSG
jgi:hypothetical protein